MKYIERHHIVREDGTVVYAWAERELSADEVIEVIRGATDVIEAPEPARKTSGKSEFIGKIRAKAAEKGAGGGQPSRKQSTCGKCGEPGHNAKTCGKKKLADEDAAWRGEQKVAAARKVEGKVKNLVQNGFSFDEIRPQVSEKDLSDDELEKLITDTKDELGL